MASSTPTTPLAKRSVSLPVNKVPSSPDPQIEILYNLPSVRIISFTTSATASKPTSRPSSSSGSPVVEEDVGSLPWISRFERTIAVGALRIYRAPGSVAFLNCANALRPILPKSQAWCVDGDSKFVLQIRPPQYWRIEVPNTTAEERLGIEELKKVLDQVLRFEKTPCPFQRNFTVFLPEEPHTPVKKKPWKPVERRNADILPFPKNPLEDIGSGSRIANSSRSVSVSPEPFSSTRSSSPLSSCGDPDCLGLLPDESVIASHEVETSIPIGAISHGDELGTISKDNSPQAPSGKVEGSVNNDIARAPSPLSAFEEEYTFGAYDDDSDDFNCTNDESDLTPKQPSFQQLLNSPEKPQALQKCSRSVTSPPVLSLVTSPPSRYRTQSRSPLRCSTIVESNSECSSSVDSFHSVQSWHSPLAPPSPPASEPSSPTSTYPYPHENIVLPKRPLNARDTSELTVTPETPRAWERSTVADDEAPKTPTLMNDGSDKSEEEPTEILTPPVTRPAIRHRATTSSNSRRRALSPLPAAVNLFSPPRRRPRRLQTARHLPTAIIQKTYEILLSPPSHLFHLMISIASKIAAGEWRGVLSGHGEAVHWDFEDEYAGDAWFEDDYGMKLPGRSTKARSTNTTVSGGSWEVD